MWGIYVGDLAAVERKLDLILKVLQQQGVTMAGTLEDLKTQVQATTDAEQAAVLLLGQLHELLQAAQQSGDPAQVQAIIDELGSSQAALAAAVKANTPGA